MKESEPFVKLMMKLREDPSSQFELAGRLTDFTDLTKRVGLVSDVAMRVMPERDVMHQGGLSYWHLRIRRSIG
jgi:hypothetical protein